MDIIKEKMRRVSEYYNSLDFATASKVTSIVTTNKKLERSAAGQMFRVAGISLYPAFKGSCSNATTCQNTCISLSGIGQLSAGDNEKITNIDKAQLKRLWMFKNETDYFYARAKNELEQITVYGQVTAYFREITSECIDMTRFEILKNVITYGYFKNPARIYDPGTKLPIYSWSEKSFTDFLPICKNNGVPIAVVVPRTMFKSLLDGQNVVKHAGVVYHDGDASDLNSHSNYLPGVINVHLLKSKTVRHGKSFGETKFLASYKQFFKFIDGESIVK